MESEEWREEKGGEKMEPMERSKGGREPQQERQIQVFTVL